MSHDTPLHRTLESLKKEAKRWLAAIRADDADARARLERAVPGTKDSPGLRDVQLADPNASRRHAELRQEGSAYWLIDLDSTNGSSVNGHRTSRAKLDSGDVITIGSTDLLFERRLVE